MKNYFKGMKCTMNKMPLVDKCLIVFMFALLVQSTYNLFFNSVYSTEMNTIDVVIRTSIAGIFGYFVSANFNRQSVNQEDTIINPIDKKSLSAQEFVRIQEAADDEMQGNRNIAYTSKLQIILITVIGIFCLEVLIGFRNAFAHEQVASVSHDTLVTLAQFRDLVSGCVGFLIGCPTNQPDKS